MNPKIEFVKKIFSRAKISYSNPPKHLEGNGFAPANIALCKYWGKRNSHLNLPEASSLSISLGNLGAKTRIRCLSAPASEDKVFLNGTEITSAHSEFKNRIIEFLDLFRGRVSDGVTDRVTDGVSDKTIYYQVETEVNIPVAAGLASSAAGFAALVKALDALYGWEFNLRELSMLARLGSGSACRSLWHGFVEWSKGLGSDGIDSHGIPLEFNWPEIRIGILIVDSTQKAISSRVAMEKTRTTSAFFESWKKKSEEDLLSLKGALRDRDFVRLGEITESNALSLHALMLTASPAIMYANEATVSLWHKLWEARKSGLNVYFTEDAGPNLKLLFLKQDIERILSIFPNCQIIAPFGD